ncbi:Thylakoid lumenal protein TL20.3, chloroplastic [Linum perenne]
MVSAAMAAAVVISSSSFQVGPAVAELNKYEANTRGEFGIGSAAQFGSADLRKAVHVNENFRRANFTSADMRESDFSGSTFNGAYMEKAVAYKANFTAMLSTLLLLCPWTTLWCHKCQHYRRILQTRFHIIRCLSLRRINPFTYFSSLSIVSATPGREVSNC